MTDDYDPTVCDRCGDEPNGMLIPVEIPITSETWDLCDPCVDDMVEWIEGDDHE